MAKSKQPLIFLLFKWCRRTLFLFFAANYCFAQQTQTQPELSLAEKSWNLYQAGDYNGATVLYEQLVQEYEKKYGPQDPQTAFALNILSGLYRATGHYDKAETTCQRAMDIDEKISGGETQHYASDLTMMAFIYSETGRASKAEPMYRHALSILEKVLGPEDSHVGTVLNNMGLLYSDMGRYADAEPMLERSLAIWKKSAGEESLDVALSMNNLADIYLATMRYEKAEQYYKRALELRQKLEGDTHPDVAQSLNNLAYLYYEMGRYVEAEPLYKKSLDIFEKLLGPDHPSLATAMNNLAGFYEFTGQFDEAEKLYKRSLEIREKALGNNSPDVAHSLNNLAGLYRSQKKYEEARPLFERVLEIEKNAYGENHPDVALAYNNLGIIYDDLGQKEKAEGLYQKGLSIREMVLGPNHPDVAVSLNNLAALYRATNRAGLAEPLFIRALHIQEKAFGPDHPNLAEFCINMGAFYDGIGKHSQAGAMFVRGVDINGKTRDSVLSAMSEQQKLKFTTTQEPNIHALINHTMQFASASPGDLQSALNAWLQWKGVVQEAQGRYLDAMMLSQDPTVREKWDQLADLRKQLAQLWIAGPGDHAEEYQKQTSELEKQKEELESQMSVLSKAFSLEQQVGRADVTRLNSLLQADDVYLDYVSTYRLDFKTGNWDDDGRYYLFVLAPSRQPRIALLDLGSAKIIDDTIHAYLKTLGADRARGVQMVEESQPSGQTTDPETLERNLYNLLVRPAEPYLKNKKRLIISPDGATHLIPFEVLKASNDLYMLDQYEITYTAAGRDLVRWSFPRSTEGDGLIFADPDYDLGTEEKNTLIAAMQIPSESTRGGVSNSLKGANFQRLPGTRMEGQNIAEILRTQMKIPVHLYQDKEALEEVLLAAHSPRILHLATHGYFLPDEKNKIEGKDGATGKTSMTEDPLVRSGIVLAGANTSLRKGESEGIVSAEKVLSLNLRNTDLVVLSACETAVGDVHRGEGVFGLKRAFILAGARTLFLSLWQVSDEATQQLMTEFYRRWASGMSKSQALREARLKVSQRYKDPYYWGAFILIGDPE